MEKQKQSMVQSKTHTQNEHPPPQEKKIQHMQTSVYREGNFCAVEDNVFPNLYFQIRQPQMPTAM